MLGAFQFQQLADGQGFLALVSRLSPTAAALADGAHNVFLVVRILDHVRTKLFQTSKGLVADFASQYGIYVRLLLLLLLLLLRRWRRLLLAVVLMLVIAGSAGPFAASCGRAAFTVGRFPRDDLLLRDDVGVVLRLLHVRRHLGQRAEALAAPHTLEDLARLLGSFAQPDVLAAN